MDDLISRAAAIETVRKAKDKSETHRMLIQLPSVDAVPARHGRWKEDPSGYGFWICSACGFVSEASAADMLYKFCPVCGAKMDGKDGDNG